MTIVGEPGHAGRRGIVTAQDADGGVVETIAAIGAALGLQRRPERHRQERRRQDAAAL